MLRAIGYVPPKQEPRARNKAVNQKHKKKEAPNELELFVMANRTLEPIKRRVAKKSPTRRRLTADELLFSFSAKEIRDTQIELLGKRAQKLIRDFRELTPSAQKKALKSFSERVMNIARRIQYLFQEQKIPMALEDVVNFLNFTDLVPNWRSVTVVDEDISPYRPSPVQKVMRGPFGAFLI